MNVLEAARARVRKAYELYDHVFVLFNGSLDSTAVLRLAQESGEPCVVWRDPELTDKHTLEFVSSELCRLRPEKSYRQVFQFRSVASCLGRRIPYLQWDLRRESYLQRPCMMEAVELDDETFLTKLSGWKRGKSIFLTGTRSADNIGQQRSAAYWQVKGPVPKATIGRIVIDWSTTDVDRYLVEKKMPVNPVYAEYRRYGERGTVSSPLGYRWMKSAHALASIDPRLIEYVLDYWPMLEAEILFPGQISESAYIESLSKTPRDLRLWIDKNVAEHERPAARRQLGKAMSLHYRDPDKYPLRYILRYFMRGMWRQKLRPIERRGKNANKAGDAEIEFRDDGSSEGADARRRGDDMAEDQAGRDVDHVLDQ